jgi:Flp pilus assembly protein TadD
MKRLSEELESLTRAVQRHDAAKALRAVSRIFENANWTWARPPRGRTGEPPAEWAADLLTGLGYRLHSTGESRAGAEVYEAVLRLRGNDPVALSCLSGIAMGQGDLRKAARLLGKAKRAAPSHPIVLLVDGHLTARRGRPGEARERYLAALQHSTSDPDRQLALYSLAVLAERREDFQEAAGYLRQALSIDETDPYVLSHLAYAESRLGEAASAEAHYRQALEECDEFSEVWVSLGTLCLERDGGCSRGIRACSRAGRFGRGGAFGDGGGNGCQRRV